MLEKIKHFKAKAQAMKKAGGKSLWLGPQKDGITFSLLSKFLNCRERFRVYAIEGIRPRDEFNHRIHYGEMWHICEQAYGNSSKDNHPVNWPEIWQALHECIVGLKQKYPLQQDLIEHWLNVCIVQFPVYVDYWKEHHNRDIWKPFWNEYTFKIDYTLPSNRTVILRGKFDSVFLNDNQEYFLQENKTKGDIRVEQIRRQLTFDLQTMFYITVLSCLLSEDTAKNLGGVIYNVVRRPLSGGKGSIVQHKPTKSNPLGESKADYYARLKQVILENVDEFFMRQKVIITDADIQKFRMTCLNPILEQLCDWWKWMDSNPTNVFANKVHWRHPYGLYNIMNEGGEDSVDSYLATQSMVGLEKMTKLFQELED